MSSLLNFSIKSLRSEELLGFSQEVENCVLRVECIATTTQAQNFCGAASNYGLARDIDRSVDYGVVQKADNNMDLVINQLRNHVQAILQYPDDAVREAANIVWRSIDQYGSPTRLSFTEEHPIVKRMLGTLESMDQNILAAAHVEAWVPLLRDRYNTFMQVYQNYVDERAACTSRRIQGTRDALCDTWKPLCEVINSMNTLHPSAELTSLIDAMNVLIASKKTSQKLRKSAKRNSESAPAATSSVD